MPLSRHKSSPASSACAGPCCQHAADLDCLCPLVAAAASTGSGRPHRQMRIANSGFAVGDLHLAGDTGRSLFPLLFSSGPMLRRLPRRLASALPAFPRDVPIIMPVLSAWSPLSLIAASYRRTCHLALVPAGRALRNSNFPRAFPLHSELFGAPERTLSSRSPRSKIARPLKKGCCPAPGGGDGRSLSRPQRGGLQKRKEVHHE